MNEKTRDEELMTRYLLGDLPDEERTRLEERFFTDDDFYEQLLALENELMYDYAQGRLPPQQRERFEKNFVKSSEDRKRAALAEAFVQKIFSSKAEALAPAPAPARRRFLEFALAAAALIVMVGAAWIVSQLNRQLESERQKRAELEQRLTQLQQAPPVIASLILQPGLTRDSREPTRLAIPSAAGLVQLQLDLRRPAAEYQSYRATLKTAEGNQIWSLDVAGTPLILKIPATSIVRGDYEITLAGLTADGRLEEAATYYFTVR